MQLIKKKRRLKMLKIFAWKLEEESSCPNHNQTTLFGGKNSVMKFRGNLQLKHVKKGRWITSNCVKRTEHRELCRTPLKREFLLFQRRLAGFCLMKICLKSTRKFFKKHKMFEQFQTIFKNKDLQGTLYQDTLKCIF